MSSALFDAISDKLSYFARRHETGACHIMPYFRGVKPMVAGDNHQSLSSLVSRWPIIFINATENIIGLWRNMKMRENMPPAIAIFILRAALSVFNTAVFHFHFISII